jgi:hypothetical protein
MPWDTCHPQLSSFLLLLHFQAMTWMWFTTLMGIASFAHANGSSWW